MNPLNLGGLDNDNEDDNDKRSCSESSSSRRILFSVHREARGRTVKPAFSRRSARLPGVGVRILGREASSRRLYTLYSRE